MKYLNIKLKISRLNKNTMINIFNHVRLRKMQVLTPPPPKCISTNFDLLSTRICVKLLLYIFTYFAKSRRINKYHEIIVICRGKGKILPQED